MNRNEINKKLKDIEKILLEEEFIDLGKQCKQEYIVYSFFFVKEERGCIKVKRMYKDHYKDDSFNELKRRSKNSVFNKTIEDTVYGFIYDLLQRGYDVLESPFHPK